MAIDQITGDSRVLYKGRVPGSAIATVVLARHGETEWNRSGRRQGRLDSPLTDLGLAHACAVAESTAGLAIDSIFASPLGRAATTAALCAERTGLTVTTIDELSEVDHGLMAGLTTEDIERLHPGELDRRAEDKYRWRFPGGESYADADRRAGIALDRIASTGVRRPLVVSHEMIGRMLRRHLLGADPTTALTWRHPHDTLYQVTVADRTVTEHRTADNLKAWTEWCDEQGAKLLDSTIDLKQIMDGFIIPVDLTARPPHVLLGLEWPWQIVGGLTAGVSVTYNDHTYQLLDVGFEVDDFSTDGPFLFSLVTPAWRLAYRATFEIAGLTYTPIAGDAEVASRPSPMPLATWINKNKPTLFLDGDSCRRRRAPVTVTGSEGCG